MTDTLPDTVAALCDEVGLPRPQPEGTGNYAVEVDGIPLRFSRIQGGKIVFSSVIGLADDLAQIRRQPLGALLSDCLALSGARFSKLATPEAITFEPGTRELLLWRRFEGELRSVSDGLAAAESLINEASFWRQWLGAN
ncbi:MAG: CesT family type III secretion system chaperone [Verrucomicrobium sp.]|nr:CesT family type III secretion system chaperone [Verrucomicrobium sp.]